MWILVRGSCYRSHAQEGVRNHMNARNEKANSFRKEKRGILARDQNQLRANYRVVQEESSCRKGEKRGWCQELPGKNLQVRVKKTLTGKKRKKKKNPGHRGGEGDLTEKGFKSLVFGKAGSFMRKKKLTGTDTAQRLDTLLKVN